MKNTPQKEKKSLTTLDAPASSWNMIKTKQLINHPLFQGSAIVLIANLIASFFNYLYHLITGRLLTPSQYGLLQSLIALTYFWGVLLSTFSLVVINITGRSRKNQLIPQIKWLEKKALGFSLIIWLVFLSLFPLFKKLLHLQSFLIYFFFTLPILFSFFSSLYQSVLRAKLKFLKFSLTLTLATFTKLVLALILILSGWQLFGAITCLVIAGLVGMLLSRFWVKRSWPETSNVTTNFNSTAAKRLRCRPDVPRGSAATSEVLPQGGFNPQGKFWSFSLLSFVTNLSLTSLYSSDILLVRYFFSPLESGLYSATSVLGKIIFFAASPVLLVVFPLFTKYKKNLPKLVWTLGFSILLMSAICLIGFTGFKLFPELIVQLLYGRAYSQASFFLPYFAVFICLTSIFNLLTQFLLSQESRLAGWLTALVASSQIFLILIRHQNLKTVIDNSVIILSLGLFLGLFFVKKTISVSKK